MGFGGALELLRADLKARRAYWPTHWYIKLQVPDDRSKMTEPYIYFVVRSAGRPDRNMPWIASHEDLLARDWQMVPQEDGEIVIG